MKAIKNFIRMAMVALAAIAVSACESNEEQQGNSSLVLAVEIDDVTATSAKIKVSHNGKMADCWYGFLTTDTKADEATLIANEVSRLKQGDVATEVKFSKSFVTVIDTLVPNTSYKYIAFGLTEYGVVYGTHASAEFMTSQNSGNNDNNSGDEVLSGMNVNPSWSIAYTGAGVIGEVDYEHTVSVVSTDNNPYTIITVYAREYDSTKLRDLGELLIEDMYSYLDSYNSSHGTSYVLNDLLYRGNGATAFDNLDPGYYIAVALGITAKGEVSGLYAASPTFEIKEEAPTSLYSSWLGDWVIEGDNKLSNDIIIGRKVANKSVNLFGLMGYSWAIVGEYSTERNDIIFYAQSVAQNVEFSDGSVGDIHLIGVDKEGNHYSLDNGNYGIAIAGVLESGQRAIVRYGVNQPDYPKFNSMILSAFVGGEYYSIGENIPAFNVMATISAPSTENEEATTRSMAPMQYSFGKSRIERNSKTLSLGKKIEVVHF